VRFGREGRFDAPQPRPFNAPDLCPGTTDGSALFSSSIRANIKDLDCGMGEELLLRRVIIGE